MKQFLQDFKPTCEQEEIDVDLIKKYDEMFLDITTRDNTLCHLTSSVFIVNEDFTKVLSIFHNIYQSWCWVGGHADGDENLLHVAIKETEEETGLNKEQIKILSNTPISIEILPVTSHVRKGKYVSGHLHLNATYLLQAKESDAIRIAEDENSNIAWLPFEDLVQKSTEPHMIITYKKIIDKIKKQYLN